MATLTDVTWKSPWPFIFIAVSIGISLLLMFGVIGPIGLFFFDGPDWVNNWSVFAINAAISGVIADQIIKRFFRASILISVHPRLPMIVVWLALMLLVGVLGPSQVFDLVHSLKLRFFGANLPPFMARNSPYSSSVASG